MNKEKFRELTGLITLKIRVDELTLQALLFHDKDNPNGAKASFIARLVIDEVVKQGLLANLVAAGRNNMYRGKV